MQTLDEMKIAIGKKFRKARKAKNIRQLDVEIDTPLTLKTVSLTENGKNNACIDTLYIYANYLGYRLKISLEKIDNDEGLKGRKEG